MWQYGRLQKLGVGMAVCRQVRAYEDYTSNPYLPFSICAWHIPSGYVMR